MANSKKRCTGCRQYFPADLKGSLDMGLNWFHNDRCAFTHWNKLKDKRSKESIRAEKREHTKAKKRLKDNDKRYQLKATQTLFNKYIRLRDNTQPCISCGSTTAGQFHAGHYRTVKAYPELRFDPRNCHKQCAQCNNFDSGNIVEYRMHLVTRIGSEALSRIEGPQKAKKYTLDDLKTIRRWYKRKIKRLELSNENNT